MVEKSGDNLYINPNELKVIFNNKFLKKGDKHDFSINTKHEIPVTILNSSEKMAKKVEIGFIFPKEVVIEKTTNISLYSDDSFQIVRFNQETIQAHENNVQGKLEITFLKSGESEIPIFIKGENVKYQKFNFKLNIVE